MSPYLKAFFLNHGGIDMKSTPDFSFNQIFYTDKEQVANYSMNAVMAKNLV